MREALEAWRPAVDEAIADLLPREVTEAYLDETFGPPTYAYDVPAIQAALSDPIWDLLDRGGKRWRAVLCLVLIEGFGGDPERLLPYACIPEILHNGTIVVDDVEDGARVRRGEPALHRRHGVDVALNAGNALYFLPLKVITHDPAGLDAAVRLRAFEMLTEELNRTHIGQGMDIRWHNQQAIEVNEPAYLEMCACKTGCLARIVTRLAAIVTGNPDQETAVARYAELLAVAFQIADDVLDVEHTEEHGGAFGKDMGNDVREGKKTLMAIHAAENAPAERVARLEEILWADDTTDEAVLEAVEILRDAGSVSYAREHALEFAAEARAALDDVDIAAPQRDQLEAFTRFVVERDI